MRYQSLGGKDNVISNGNFFFNAPKLISLEIWSAYQQFGVTKECTASPFNSTAETFWSAFTDTDCFFGSKGNFFESHSLVPKPVYLD